MSDAESGLPAGHAGARPPGGDSPPAAAPAVADDYPSFGSPPPRQRPRPSEPPDSPVHWLEICCLLLMVALCDVTTYRGHGFAGAALLFAAAPLLLQAGAARGRIGGGASLFLVLLWCLAARLLWSGSGLAVVAGLVLMVGYAMSLAGIPPYVLESLVFVTQSIQSGNRRLHAYVQYLHTLLRPLTLANWIAIALPLLVFLVFSVLFVLANPNLLTFFNEQISHFVETFRNYVVELLPQPLEIMFWLATGWFTIGLFQLVLQRRKALYERQSASVGDQSDPTLIEIDSAAEPTPASTPLYAAFRNSLVLLIGLFACYLVFEFQSLWFRVFPPGFYYSGYAHEGAAWLTVALALATLTLSVIFRGRLLTDSRLPRLRKLAWVWSVENMLLAIAVYHRLFIYVGFNGMTRMRIVGFFGLSAVVVGFLCVLVKIIRNRTFLWLMRRHVWTVALAVYLFALTPVDWLAMRYNVRRILAGDPAPSVQISVHTISAEGYLALSPLLDCQNSVIREGLRALLAGRLQQAEMEAFERGSGGWTAAQFADQKLLKELRALEPSLNSTNRAARDAALMEFHGYAYQWF